MEKEQLFDALHNQTNIIFESNNELKYKELWVVCWMVLFEYILLFIEKKKLPAVHENVISMSHAVFFQIGRFLFRALESKAYSLIWQNYAMFPQLFSDSVSSFAMSLLITDLGFYWFHRATHEMMILWTVHQVHHISDEYTVSVGLRHSPIQSFFSWTFYLPFAALGLPPSQMILQLQLSLLYQTWLHTCSISNLGPLEWMLNTPSHHRVHHGSTAYCIDKNFGGVLIIWDYIFGTFEKERTDEAIVYGLVFPTGTWNPLKHQTHYMEKMYLKAKSMTTWKDFFNTIWKGPSWSPGLSRLGREVATPDTSMKELTKANTSVLINCYAILHLIGSMCLVTAITSQNNLSYFTEVSYILFTMATLTNIGNIYDGKRIARPFEIVRSVAGTILFLAFPNERSCIHIFLAALNLSSAWLWLSSFHQKFTLEDISTCLKND